MIIAGDIHGTSSSFIVRLQCFKGGSYRVSMPPHWYFLEKTMTSVVHGSEDHTCIRMAFEFSISFAPSVQVNFIPTSSHLLNFLLNCPSQAVFISPISHPLRFMEKNSHSTVETQHESWPKGPPGSSCIHETQKKRWLPGI